MGKYFCNPINVPYKYQFNKDPRKQKMSICREAADPTLILFKGKYYIFASMSLGVYVSDDLTSWQYHKLPLNLPLYDYAPDARVRGDYVYFCASSREHECHRFKTKDIINGPYIEIKEKTRYWDPNLFFDDDGRVYFYCGCTNVDPIWGVELDKDSLKPIGQRVGLIYGDPYLKGFERLGDDNTILPASEEEIENNYKAFMKKMKIPSLFMPKKYRILIKGMFKNTPYIEGAWMDKFNNKYYLQYGTPGTQYNIYCDGVYVSDSPLGEFKLQENNPYSYKPGGFINGAGHGSTMLDKENSLWHVSSMRISRIHDFERRIGLFKSGIDEDGELFCNQNFADYPYDIDTLRKDPWSLPKWNLLSYKKNVKVSSTYKDNVASNAVDENIRTIWQGNTPNNEWIEVDLGDILDVRAIQVNFGDGDINIEAPGKIVGTTQARYIEERNLKTRYILKGSNDGENYFVIEDKSNVDTDLTHDLIVREEGINARFIKLEIIEVPYNQKPAISGLRVFGFNENKILPKIPNYKITRIGDTNIEIEIESKDDVTGYNILFGTKEDKLYHSYMIFNNKINIGALIKGKTYFFRVDAFNEKGITKGEIKHE
jgi:hypothetical protein